jgi:hypothetical protein
MHSTRPWMPSRPLEPLPTAPTRPVRIRGNPPRFHWSHQWLLQWPRWNPQKTTVFPLEPLEPPQIIRSRIRKHTLAIKQMFYCTVSQGSREVSLLKWLKWL